MVEVIWGQNLGAKMRQPSPTSECYQAATQTHLPQMSHVVFMISLFFFPLNSRMKNQACRTGLHSETTTVDSQENCPLSSLRGMVALWVTSACLHRPSTVPALGPVPGGVQPPLSHQASSSASPLPSPPAAPPEGRSLLTGVFIL